MIREAENKMCLPSTGDRRSSFLVTISGFERTVYGSARHKILLIISILLRDLLSLIE